MTNSEIRTILLKDWDPIDVGDNPNLSDEYDAYLADLTKLVTDGASGDEIARYLKTVEETLGLKLPAERRRRAAEALTQLTIRSPSSRLA
jgi:hypothetical protein